MEEEEERGVGEKSVSWHRRGGRTHCDEAVEGVAGPRDWCRARQAP